MSINTVIPDFKRAQSALLCFTLASNDAFPGFFFVAKREGSVAVCLLPLLFDRDIQAFFIFESSRASASFL